MKHALDDSVTLQQNLFCKKKKKRLGMPSRTNSAVSLTLKNR